MGRFYLAIAMFVLFSASPASAQYAAVVQACRGDAKQFCAAVQSGGGQLAECIKTNFQGLSEPCKATLARTAGVVESCRADVRQQCPGIKPGAGRILLCIQQHFASLSAPCKHASGRADARTTAAPGTRRPATPAASRSPAGGLAYGSDFI